jgi:uncharacterized protein (TIGR02421 family)
MKFIDYKSLDQKIGEIAISTQLNILFYINPQNLDEEKEKFFQELKQGNEYNPKFLYPSKNPLYSYFAMKPTFETYKTELRELLEDIGSDCLGLLYENKILDILENIELVKSIGTPNFFENSKQVYGAVDKKLLKLAKEEINKNIRSKKEKKLSFEETKTRINNFLKRKRLNYKIELRESAGSTFAINPKEKKLSINKNAKFDEGVVKRLLAHEFETHAYRYENGAIQPYAILSQGTSKMTLETEEGLAVNVEKLKRLDVGLQLKTYAGRVLAIDLAGKKSFYQTFKELQKNFSNEEAFTLTLRAKRGTYKTSEAGAFTKDMLYFKGMFKVEKFLKEHDIKELYYGKYSIEDYSLVKGVDGLREPKYLPELLK